MTAALHAVTTTILDRARAHLAEEPQPERDTEGNVVWHPSTKDPRDVGAPMPLNPPKQPKPKPAPKPKPQESEASVVLRWLFQTTDLKRSPFRIRGQVAILKPVWMGD